MIHIKQSLAYISRILCLTHSYHRVIYHANLALKRRFTALIEFYSNWCICCIQTFVHQATERHVLCCKRDELCWSDEIQGPDGVFSLSCVPESLECVCSPRPPPPLIKSVLWLCVRCRYFILKQNSTEALLGSLVDSRISSRTLPNTRDGLQ